MKFKNKTFHIVVIGCQMNKSDSERVAGYMELHGFREESREKADIVFITTCGIRQTAEDRIYGLVPQIKKDNKDVYIIITGCLSGRKDVIRRLKESVDLWLSITDLHQLSQKLGIKTENQKMHNYLNILPKHNSKFSAFVPIGNGCDNFCTYCVVPYARGREVYRGAEEILSEVGELVDSGYKEITLIAQNVNSYVSRLNKDDEEINFSRLLKLVNDIDGGFWIRFSTSHPKDMSKELIETVAGCDKLCKHIHLPVQAGDDEILEKMNRGYTVAHYLKLVDLIKEKLPNASITTDSIVGFPGETEEQFNNTVDLYNKVGYDMTFVSQFSPRFGTAAAKMEDDVGKEEKTRRESVLLDIVRKSALQNNQYYLNKIVKVLIEGVSRKGLLFGKTDSFKVMKISYKSPIDNYENFIGKFVDVKVLEVKELSLYGKLV